MDGCLEQFDGQRAGIAKIYMLSDADDVALIEVGPGIDAEIFKIAQDPLKIGQRATMSGHGETHEYASSTTAMIVDHREKMDFESAVYTDLFEARYATTSRSCSGDSGGPVYIGSTVYAVHTAGGFNPSCADGKDMLMWHTNIASRAGWIADTIRTNVGLTESEKIKAATGLNASAPGGRELNAYEETRNHYQGLLSSSFSNSWNISSTEKQ